MPSNETPPTRRSTNSAATNSAAPNSNVVDARLRFSARNDASSTEGHAVADSVTEQAVDRAIDSSDLLHLVTHGTPSDLRQLRSALRADAGDDGLSPELFDPPSIRRDILDTIAYRDLMSTHLPSETLVALAFGVDLSLEDSASEDSASEDGIDRATAEAHLAVCPSCRDELALMHGTEAEIADPVTPFERPAATHPTPRTHTAPAVGGWRTAIALAAMLLLAVTIPSLLPSSWSSLAPGDTTPQSTIATSTGTADTAPHSAPNAHGTSLLIDGFESQDLSAWSAVDGHVDTSDAR